MKTAITKLAIAASVASMLAGAPSTGHTLSSGSSESASTFFVIGSVATVFASAALANGGAKVMVDTMEASGNAVSVILRDLGDGSKHSVTFTGTGLHKTSDWVGKTFRVIATSSGTILASDDKVLAFLVNERAKHLFHTSGYWGPK